MQKRLESIQLLRGVAVVLVVILHIFAFEPKAVLGATLLPAISVFGSSGVDLFFVISGFVMVYTSWELKRSSAEVLRFLYKRAARIYPLYWLLSACLLVAYLSLPQLVQRTDWEEMNVLHSFLLIPQNTEPLLLVGWTLIHELYFYLVFSFFILLRRSHWSFALCLWLSTLIATSYFVENIYALPPFLELVAHPLTLEFILGCLAALLYRRFVSTHGSILAIASFSLLLLLWGLHYYLSNAAGLVGWTRACLFGLPYATIVYALACAEQHRPQCFSRVRSSSFFILLGDASYAIYLSHFLLISLCARVSALAFKSSGVGNFSFADSLIFIALSLIASLSGGVLLHYRVERMLLNLTRLPRSQRSDIKPLKAVTN